MRRSSSRVASLFAGLLIVAMALALAACSGGTDRQGSQAGAAASGEADAMTLYKKQCLSCHAADLSGRVGPSLQEIGSKMSEQQLIDTIQDGAKGMPAFKKVIRADEIETLAQWLSTHTQAEEDKP
ncbi:c-type cytochrome [Paenibacillus thiaminolyticus]|uniref:c-type cytochrome n=1 Tax=Paenibacillus thiaminolyticus TaxID=49283 RepID=UPI002543B585|nr:c-type cytochrome [Paenibacillus thiaminolyticus]WII35250.1 c-type cytochrome [Paenibacillus thiaminolyticus]